MIWMIVITVIALTDLMLAIAIGRLAGRDEEDEEKRDM